MQPYGYVMPNLMGRLAKAGPLLLRGQGNGRQAQGQKMILTGFVSPPLLQASLELTGSLSILNIVYCGPQDP